MRQDRRPKGAWRIEMPEGQLREMTVAVIGLSGVEREGALARLPERVRTSDLSVEAIDAGALEGRVVAADVVVAPVFGPPFDAFELCGWLLDAGYRGQVMLVGKGLADASMIERELSAAHRGLALRVLGLRAHA